MKLICAILILFFCSCNENPGFLHHYQLPEGEAISRTHSIKELSIGRNKVDIIWVIDNSGSMEPFQTSVINNTERFMNEFTQVTHVDWKMALLSTSEYEDPYLGMAAPFNSTHPTPVPVFQAAVKKLGTYGDTTEKTYDPIVKALKANPQFMRQDAWLVLIIVTDEEEQSRLDSDQFLAWIYGLVQPSYVKTYAAFGASDLGCTRGNFQFRSSEYELLMKKTKGLYFSACSATFGDEMAKMGKDIVTQLSRPRLILEKRPLLSTLSVSYKGKALPGGPAQSGGLWYYDFTGNAVVFYSLAFAPGQNEQVEVSYTADIGYGH